MKTVANVIGWVLRASAAICIVYVGVSAGTGAEQYASFGAIVGSVAFHAVCAVTGTQLVGFARGGQHAPAVVQHG